MAMKRRVVKLTTLSAVDERAEHRAEWVRLRGDGDDKLGQVDPVSKVGAGRSNEGGIRLAVREMPKLDGKTEEAKRSQLRRQPVRDRAAATTLYAAATASTEFSATVNE